MLFFPSSSDHFLLALVKAFLFDLYLAEKIGTHQIALRGGPILQKKHAIIKSFMKYLGGFHR